MTDAQRMQLADEIRALSGAIDLCCFCIDDAYNRGEVLDASDTIKERLGRLNEIADELVDDPPPVDAAACQRAEARAIEINRQRRGGKPKPTRPAARYLLWRDELIPYFREIFAPASW